MKITNDSKKQSIDLDLLIEETFQKYDAVFFSEIDGQLFAYRPIGRKEYKDIITDESLNEWDKQDKLCETALIYPENFNFDDCLAGVPDELSKDIIEKSCLDPESMLYLLHMNRQEADQLGSEMACIIAEAFPSYTMDEIESWNNFKFTKLYAQAEWILKNIRGVQFQVDVAQYLAEVAGISDEDLEKMGIEKINNSISENTNTTYQQSYQSQQSSYKSNNTNQNSNTNEKMSPEQMRAYQEFVRQHPEFADKMQYDSAFTGFNTQKADTVNPALRPGWYHNH